MKILVYYLAGISLLAVIMTVTDKIAARRGTWRISENALMCAAAFGGSAAMYVTMLLVRHKTKHVKFMAGLPLIMAVQVVFAVFLISFLRRRNGL